MSARVADAALDIGELMKLASSPDPLAFRRGLVLAKEQGLDVNLKTINGTLLHMACFGCVENVIELLSEEGAGRKAGFHAVNAVNSIGETALHICMHSTTQTQRENIVLELLEKSGIMAGFVAVSAQNIYGSTALHSPTCTKQGVRSIIQRVEQIEGADGKRRLIRLLSATGHTILHNAQPSKIEGLMECCTAEEIIFLMQTTTINGWPALHTIHNPTAIKTLLSLSHIRLHHHLQPTPRLNDVMDTNGRTALHFAMREWYFGYRQFEIVSALIFPNRKPRRGSTSASENNDNDNDDFRGDGDVDEMERWIIGGVDPNIGCSERQMRLGPR